MANRESGPKRKLHYSPDRKIVAAELRLAEKNPDYGDLAVWVWLNPPKGLINELEFELLPEGKKNRELVKLDLPPKVQERARREEQAVNRRMNEILADLWSKGPAGTQYTPEEADQFITELHSTDPLCMIWLIRITIFLALTYKP